jgi:ATP/ADP translocase
MDVCLWLFIYGFVYTFFQVVPAFLKGGFAGPVSQGDALDFLTPVAVIPVAVMLFFRLKETPGRNDRGGSACSSMVTGAVFVFGLIAYVEGHGIHLSANAIDRLLHGEEGSGLYQAVYLFDEVISHFIWDAGVLIIAVGLILAGRRARFPSLAPLQRVYLIGGACFFGFSYAVNAIEGQTVPLTLPAAILMIFVCLWLHRKSRREGGYDAVVLFFLLGFILSMLLFVYWGIAHPGFTEFSELGWI